MSLPLVDLARQHAALKGELDAAICRVLDSSQFVLGDEVQQFEEEFSTYCGTRFAIACANGTDALEMALTAAGVGAGDEVLVPSMTFAATAEAVVRCGAIPRFVDVDRHLLMDIKATEAAITPRTRAVVPVHLYGNCLDVTALLDLAERRGLLVIEDAAQAHGASIRGTRAGSSGVAGCFSFYPGKNLGAIGDAGAVVTNDEALAERVRMARDHGRMGKYEHAVVGRNSRMDALQGAVLRVKLTHLEGWNERRRAIAEHYREAFQASGLESISPIPDSIPVYHQFVVRHEARDAVAQRLGEQGIMTGVHYPIPLHRQPAFAAYAGERLPSAERAAAEVLSLPIFPEMNSGEVDRVAAAVLAATRGPS